MGFGRQMKIDLEITTGRFVTKTISTQADLKESYRLRYQVFKVEMLGYEAVVGEDYDEFDELADHLAIYDTKTQQMVATCRLNCSLSVKRFYSELEFQCASLIQRPETKVELGRVCVHKDFRKGVIVMILWRALADYMQKAEAKFLFGCGSVLTQNAYEMWVLYKYLQHQNKVNTAWDIYPTEKYRMPELEILLSQPEQGLSQEEAAFAVELLPPLCRSYFDIGCYTPGPPAYDREFKCIDFLTILDSEQLNSKVRQKMMGADSR
jgi:putative hemolysin